MRRSTTFLAACLALAFCLSSLQAQEAMPYTFVGSDIISTDNGWTVSVTRLAPYELSGVVIGTHRYNDPDLPYSPVDLAVAWGPVAKPGAGTFTVTMGGRQLAYVWASRDPSITERDVATHVSNNHIIPASPQVYAAVVAVESGDTIHMGGYLVDLDGYREEGSTLYRSHWGPSSLVRDDEGPGACEIFLVEVLSVNGEHAQPVEQTEQRCRHPCPPSPNPRSLRLQRLELSMWAYGACTDGPCLPGVGFSFGSWHRREYLPSSPYSRIPFTGTHCWHGACGWHGACPPHHKAMKRFYTITET
jgi:hypothetical protein